MNLKYLLSLCSVLMLMQTIFSSDYDWSPKESYELKKYIKKAHSKERAYDKAHYDSDDAFNIATAATAASCIGACINPALLPWLAGNVGVVGGLAAGAIYKHYITKTPYRFSEKLEELHKLIDTRKSTFIGGKEYMLAKQFNDLEGTGYIQMNPTLEAVCSAEGHGMHQLTNQKQYEIYVMPNDSYLVYAFDAITKALKDAQSIAFIAIRPTPILTNNAKQILPRIVIVLKQGADKKAAEQILQIAYTALKNETYIKSVGYQPRYSQQVTVQDNAWTPVTENLKKMFFIGMGNTDFKMLHPEQFERKKFLGITRQGDMAYPLNTPEAEKIHTIVIGK